MARLVRNDLERHLRQLKLRQPRLIRELCNAAIFQFQRINFASQGFVDLKGGGVQRWKPRKNNSDPGRPILQKTGRMRASIHTASISSTGGRIVASVHYSGKHNYGIGIAKRQFMGVSKDLDSKSLALIDRHVRKIIHIT